MNRRNRFALIGAAALLLVAAGSALANRAPVTDDGPAAPASSHEPDDGEGVKEPVTAEDLAHAADRLTLSEIAFEDGQLADLADRYGLGGAVRVLAWAEETGLSVDEITTMRDGTDSEPPMGWGRIAKELDVHPGIGKVMGNGNGHGRDSAPGQEKQQADE
ncbi:MAG: hypothetical protein K5924_03300 [Chloroflexi bacterium]|nr:hypothetical protein [Chloroflexota bacterium]